MLNTAICMFFKSIEMPPPNPGDKFNVFYDRDILVVAVSRQANGAVEKACFRCIDNQFQLRCPISASQMSRVERNRIILKLRNTEFSQRQIADIVGVTQQTVSNVLRGASN